MSPHPSHPNHTPPPIVASSLVVQNGLIPSYTEQQDTPLTVEITSESSNYFPKSTTLLSKVKSIARQGVTESNKLQRPVQIVKDLFSSLANPPITGGPQPTLYTNDNFVPAVNRPPPLPAVSPPPLEQGEMVVTTPPPTEEPEEPDGPIMSPQTAQFVDATNSTW